MGWFEQDNADFNNTHHAKVTHELLGGAAAYAAAREYEKYCEKNGKPVDHAGAKALVAGFAGAALDRLVETKGLDAWDAHKRKQALDHAHGQLNETVVVENQWN